jgi:hypothetical protein
MEFTLTLDNKPYRILALSYRSKLEFLLVLVQACVLRSCPMAMCFLERRAPATVLQPSTAVLV